MIEDDYYYELKYKNKDYEVTVKFKADIDADELRENLADFLGACSWSDKAIEEYILDGGFQGGDCNGMTLDCMGGCGKGGCYNVG